MKYCDGASYSSYLTDPVTKVRTYVNSIVPCPADTRTLGCLCPFHPPPELRRNNVIDLLDGNDWQVRGNGTVYYRGQRVHEAFMDEFAVNHGLMEGGCADE